MVNLVPKVEVMDSSSSPFTTDSVPARNNFLSVDYETQPNVTNVMKANTVDVIQSTDSLTFYNETLELSQEDIQKTLSANMPMNEKNAATQHVSDLNDRTIHHPAAPDFIDDCCDDGNIDVVPSTVHDDDVFVNLDAFDMFVEFPELDLDTKASISCSTENNIIDIAGGGGGDQIHMGIQLRSQTESNSRLLSDGMDNHSECDPALSSVQFTPQSRDTTADARNNLYIISDFSPEWAYPEGGIKVLVTGPWNEDSNYTVMFDSFPVPTTIVQSGVLRCYCPAHEVGLVTLQVACDGYVISNSCIFEYKSPISTENESECDGTTNSTNVANNDDSLYKFTLYHRLESIEKRMEIKMEPSDSVRMSLQGYCNHLLVWRMHFRFRNCNSAYFIMSLWMDIRIHWPEVSFEIIWIRMMTFLASKPQKPSN